MQLVAKLKVEYKAASPAWVIGLKLMDSGKFKALVEYPIPSTSNDSGTTLKKELVDVTEEWINKEYGEDMANTVQYVREREYNGNFFPLPELLTEQTNPCGQQNQKSALCPRKNS